MKLKPAFLISLALLAMFLIACAKAPSAPEAAPTGPSAAPAASEAGEAMAEKPVAPEAQFKITKQAALKNPSRVVFTVENIGEVDSSLELTVGLVYARKIVDSKTTKVSLNKGEGKEVAVEFPDTTNFVSYTIEGAGLINPVRPAGVS